MFPRSYQWRVRNELGSKERERNNWICCVVRALAILYPATGLIEITETHDAKKERHITKHALGSEKSRSKNSIVKRKPMSEDMLAIETLTSDRMQPSQNPGEMRDSIFIGRIF